MKSVRSSVFIHFICVSLLFSQLNCKDCNVQQATKVNGLVELSANMIALLVNLADLVGIFSKRLDDTKALTEKSLAEKKDIVTIGKFLEDQRDVLHEQYNTISQVFANIQLQSMEYFNELDNNTAAIPNLVVKKSEEELNQKKKAEWLTAYNNASKDISALSNSLSQYETVYRVVRNQIIRSDTDNAINSLRELSSQVQILDSRVKVFTSNAQMIFAEKSRN